MDVLSLLGKLCPVEPEALDHRTLLLPRFVGLHHSPVALLSLKDLVEFESRGNNEMLQPDLL